MLTKQAVKRATTSILSIAASENRFKNRSQSMNETQDQSPKDCFSRDSYLIYKTLRDSLPRRTRVRRARRDKLRDEAIQNCNAAWIASLRSQ